jgi:GT2 family glycosyltransferase
MAVRVSVIIVNWNGLVLLQQCLEALSEQTFSDFETIVVDNGSNDGSVEWLRVHYPAVRLICNDENAGFAAGNNQAILASEAEFIVTLNNDTRVEPGWLAALVAAVEGDQTVGMGACKMLFADRPEIINSTGINLDRVGIAWDRSGGEYDDASETQPFEVFGPSAGAALYRREMLDQIGLFDEGFFMYLEDVDLAWRARLAGWRCLCAPSSRVYHVHSASAGEGSAFKNRLLGRNKVWTIAKNYPLGKLALFLPLILLYDAAAALFALVARRDVFAVRGRWEALKGMCGVWRNRRQIQALRRWDSGRPWDDYLSPLVPPWRVPDRYRHIIAAKR